jgi:TrmH family RNA methyltransferase
LVSWSPPSFEGLLGSVPDEGLIVVAHGVQDPGNLGSLLRTADAAGAAAFFLTGEAADLTHPRALRATMGSIFRLPAAPAPSDRIVEALRRRGFRTVGSSPSSPVAYHVERWTGPLALFLGGEGGGLPVELLSRLDASVGIPMRRGVESLSVGAAAAVLLFEAARQRAGALSDPGDG